MNLYRWRLKCVYIANNGEIESPLCCREFDAVMLIMNTKPAASHSDAENKKSCHR